MISVGVDGCKAGWVAASIGDEGVPEVAVFPSIDTLWVAWGAAAESILIDVPIGLTDADSCRPCDREARRLLRAPRASSVFNPPVRAALVASSWAEAASLNQSACGTRISKQTWAILPKIAEVDTFLDESPARNQKVREVHPEVLFYVLNSCRPLTHRKARSPGVQERLDILEATFEGSRRTAEAAFQKIPRNLAKRDDIVDALVAAVVGYVHRGRLRTIPAMPGVDRRGRRMEIVLPFSSALSTAV